jgi:photosystem II stability/assembly factor-like uncharacterized protein
LGYWIGVIFNNIEGKIQGAPEEAMNNINKFWMIFHRQLGEGFIMPKAKFLLLALLAGSALAGATALPPAMAQEAQVAGEATDVPRDGMKYRLIGPYRGGRSTGVAGISEDINTYYMGTSAGGVWKTEDAGTTWTPLWDKFPEASPSVGAIVVAPSNPNIVYVGTGESAIRGNVVSGNGVYKSLDAGKTWKYAGLRSSEFIGRMAISATDPNTVFVAALGPILGTGGGERGIYRTRDGGGSWERVLHVDDQTGGVDIQIDPTNPQILYAAMWQVHRKPWIMESGGPGSGLYRSTDGGNSWERLTGNGLPTGTLGRIGVAPTSDPKRIYALIEAEDGGLFRTDDGGASWQLVNSDGKLRQRAWYYTTVYADPKDSNKVFVLNVDGMKSDDGGKTFAKMPVFHGDVHQLWINPRDPRYMINANDGGAGVSFNGGTTWSEQMNQATAQIYHISVDNQYPYNIYGAQQDNTTIRIPSASVRGSIDVGSWRSVGGGESGYIHADPKNPSIVYAGSYWGELTRYDDTTGQTVQIKPWPRETMGWAPKDLKHRGGWTTPFIFSPHDPKTLYYANEVLFKTTDEGKSWDIISPDLTRNDKSKQLASGGVLTKDNTSIEVYNTIFSFDESPVARGTIWVGTDDGLIQLTRDEGKTWANVTPPAMPEWGTVASVAPHSRKAGTAYISVERHKQGDYKPYAFRTDDFGKTWTSITAGLPSDAYLHVIRHDPERDGLLYAGTENGIFVSFDDGANWKPLQLNLPRTPIHDLVVHRGDIAVATHGRSFWVLDDISPVRQWSRETASAAVHLFKPRTAVRIRYGRGGEMRGNFAGANPPEGAILYYSLKSDVPKEQIKLEILDATGKAIRSYVPSKQDPAPGSDDESGRGPKQASLGYKAGLNRFAWDMRHDSPAVVPNAALWGRAGRGPVALPGNYSVRLTVKGKAYTQPFALMANPASTVTAEELREQFDLGVAVNKELVAVNDAILEIRQLHSRIAEIRKHAAAGTVTAEIDALETKANAVEEKLIQKKSIAPQDPLNYPVRLNNMLASLSGTVGEADAAPSKQLYAEFEELKAMSLAYIGEWNAIKNGDIPTVDAALAKNGIPKLALKK